MRTAFGCAIFPENGLFFYQNPIYAILEIDLDEEKSYLEKGF
jgi:hypothetical protein